MKYHCFVMRAQQGKLAGLERRLEILEEQIELEIQRIKR
jgi:hypothetical protein